MPAGIHRSIQAPCVQALTGSRKMNSSMTPHTSCLSPFSVVAARRSTLGRPPAVRLLEEEDHAVLLLVLGALQPHLTHPGALQPQQDVIQVVRVHLHLGGGSRRGA